MEAARRRRNTDETTDREGKVARDRTERWAQQTGKTLQVKEFAFLSYGQSRATE